ncbi:hypothetical protein IFR04_005363 [Cadophora malorum]|uniref:Uncharacterized protein n=1 Tax=Cadophora malorum TaxID=108018 RepID=A0A8H7TKY5_9HELO|nr:hypothetical protein IFR04_005363 [Cadophora malorum]
MKNLKAKYEDIMSSATLTIAEMDNLDHTIQRLEEEMDKVLDAGTISAHAPASSMSTEKPVAKAPSAHPDTS